MTAHRCAGGLKKKLDLLFCLYLQKSLDKYFMNFMKYFCEIDALCFGVWSELGVRYFLLFDVVSVSLPAIMLL